MSKDEIKERLSKLLGVDTATYSNKDMWLGQLTDEASPTATHKFPEKNKESQKLQ
jgi:hypothetical protein